MCSEKEECVCVFVYLVLASRSIWRSIRGCMDGPAGPVPPLMHPFGYPYFYMLL